MAIINKDELQHLANLARIELTSEEEERFLSDLEKILNHFEELKSLDTEHVPAMTGGTELKNVMREDENENKPLPREAAIDAFPETERGYLKVPHVFNDSNQ